MQATPPETGRGTAEGLDAQVALLERRLAREKAARLAAEALLGSKSAELYEALEAASDAQRRLELALWASREAIFEWSAHDGLIRSRAFDDGQARDVLAPMRDEDLIERIHPSDRDAARMAWRMLQAGAAADLDAAFRVVDGAGWRWLRVRGRGIDHDGSGRVVRAVGTIKDITRQRAAEESLRLMAHAFGSTRDAMAVASEDWSLIEANTAFLELARAGDAALAGMSLTACFDTVGCRPPEGGTWRGERSFRTADGRQVPVDVSVARFTRGAGDTPCLIVTLRDVTERKARERDLARMATQDALTGLPNRVALQRALDDRFCAHPAATGFALLFVDLDGFKEVNDSLGHDSGDELLRGVATRLTATLGPHDLLARWGGDEFVVVLGPGSDQAIARAAARRIVDALAERFEIAGMIVSVTPSIGIAIAPGDGLDGTTLLRRADTAMYEAKENGRNRYEFYRPQLDAGALQRMELIAALRAAAEAQAFRFVAQPKVDVSGALHGAEILARWDTERWGTVSPAWFIPEAERLGLIDRITQGAIGTACRMLESIGTRAAGVGAAVNLSGRQLLDPRTEPMLLEACARHGVDPRAIELEVTESSLIANLSGARRMLERLRNAGFRTALDDFGTGYSSLQYLRELPLDTVKIDRSFVRDVHVDARARALLSGIVQLARSLGLVTVAEGVESTEQLTLLDSMGIDLFQGYLFSRPMPAPALAGSFGSAQGVPRFPL